MHSGVGKTHCTVRIPCDSVAFLFSIAHSPTMRWTC